MSWWVGRWIGIGKGWAQAFVSLAGLYIDTFPVHVTDTSSHNPTT